MKDFLLFCLKCTIDFLLHVAGTIIAGIGFIMIAGGFAVEFWPMTVLGVLMLLGGAWMQYRT